MRRLLARVYVRALSGFESAVGVGRGLFEGFWLGALDIEDLYAVDTWYYAHSSEYVAESHYRRGLFEWERVMLERHFAPGGRILVTAVGGGREVAALLHAGYDARGFECNRTLVDAATRLLDADGHSDRVEWIDRGAWPEPSTPFDGVILGWGSYTLVPTATDRVRMLQEASAHVVSGGPILLSFLATEQFGRTDRFVARLATVIRRVLGRRPVEIGDRLAPNFVHVFTRDQIEREVCAAGLELRDFGVDGYGHAVAVLPIA